MANSRQTVIPSARRSLTNTISSRSSAGVTRRWSSGHSRSSPAWMFSTGPLRHAVFNRALARQARRLGAWSQLGDQCLVPSVALIQRWPGLGVRRGPRVYQHQHVDQERVLILGKESGEGRPIDALDGIEAARPRTVDAGGKRRCPGWDEHLSLLGQDDHLRASRSGRRKRIAADHVVVYRPLQPECWPAACTSPGYGIPVAGPDPQVESPTPNAISSAPVTSSCPGCPAQPSRTGSRW